MIKALIRRFIPINQPSKLIPCRDEAGPMGISKNLYDVDVSKFQKFSDSFVEDGGLFHCLHFLYLEPGEYICNFIAKDLAVGAYAEALAWKAGVSRVVGQSAYVKSVSGTTKWSSFFKLELKSAERIEFRSYTSEGFATATLEYLTIQAATPSDTSIISDQPLSWPVRQLQWVVIGTTNVCNASCESCPTNKESTSHIARTYMRMDLFRSIVDQIKSKEIEISGHISLGLFGDTLTDPFIVERAAYLKASIPKVRIVIATNGAAANGQLVRRLSQFVDEFSVHVEAMDSELYQQLMAPLTAERVFPRIDAILKNREPGVKVTIATPLSLLNIHEFSKIKEYWMGRGADYISALTLNGRCSKDGEFTKIGLLPAPGRCGGQIMSNLIVDADGSVLACCEDFERTETLGNFCEETLEELLANASRKNFHDKLQSGEWSKLRSCSSCLLGDAAEMQRLLCDTDKAA